MKRIITASTIALCFTLSASGWSEEEHKHGGHDQHNTTEAVPVENALKNEMRLLDGAYKNLLDSILLGMPEAIERPFHDVHRAKMATEKAIRSGKVKLPKNGDRLDEFVEMDEAFHDKLRKLLSAARKKDHKGILDSAHEILDGCVQCHSKFRN